jgi:oligosaccharide repeat unit polymerase
MSKILMPPSFYMWSSWIAVLFIYLLQPIPLEPLRLDFLFIIFYVVLVALISNLIFKEVYFRKNTQLRLRATSMSLLVFVACTLLGFVGIYSYLIYISNIMGGMGALLALIIINPLEIRAIAIDELGGAVQLSYFSWISIGIGTFLVLQPGYRKSTKLFLILLVAGTFILNMLFIDRTRPIWLIFIVAITCISLSKNPRRAMVRFVILTPITILLLFVLFSIFTGKLTEGGLTETLSIYILSGFSYSNFLSGSLMEFDYMPIRTFYPVSKVLEAFGFTTDVPSQILEFYDVPFPTNVGGFVEPLLSDGGMVFVILGVPLIVLMTDWLGLASLQSRTYFGVFLYANLIFINFFSFFVAKFSSTPIYLFLGIFLMTRMMFQLSRRSTFLPVRPGIGMN